MRRRPASVARRANQDKWVQHWLADYRRHYRLPRTHPLPVAHVAAQFCYPLDRDWSEFGANGNADHGVVA